MVGWRRNSAGLSLLVWKVGDWRNSSAGPRLSAVIQPGMICSGASSSTTGSGPLLNVGGSLTGRMVRLKLCGALRSAPPLSVPPLSTSVTVTSAVPLASGAGVKVSVPAESRAGGAAKRERSSTLTVKESAWPASSGGPALRCEAQLGNVCGPASSSTVMSGPMVKRGASLTGLTTSRKEALVV